MFPLQCILALLAPGSAGSTRASACPRFFLALPAVSVLVHVLFTDRKAVKAPLVGAGVDPALRSPGPWWGSGKGAANTIPHPSMPAGRGKLDQW